MEHRDFLPPDVRHVRTSDGVNLAYWTLGHGSPPLVIQTGFPPSHLELEWNVPKLRRCYEALARGRRIVRYDWRGAGLSDRDVNDLSFPTQCQDLEVLVRALELDEFSIFASGNAGPVAIAYAANHPRDVKHLMLWHSFATATDYLSTPRIQALVSLIDRDWELYAQSSVLARNGWMDRETAQAHAALLEGSRTPEGYTRALTALSTFDAIPYLGQVQAPTLVIHRREFKGVDFKLSSKLVASIPKARLAVLEGSSGSFYDGDVNSVVNLIEEFLSPGEAARRPGLKDVFEREEAPLTKREIEMVCLLAMGLRSKEIAARLNVSLYTVQRHIANIYSKIGVHGRAEATAYAIRKGFL